MSDSLKKFQEDMEQDKATDKKWKELKEKKKRRRRHGEVF
jgi:hypothetical protein